MSKSPFGYLMVAVFCGVALASVAGGFALIGAPSEQRLMALDDKRVSELRRLRYAVQRYHTRNGRLPESLAKISAEWVGGTIDPVSGEPYTYGVTGVRSFQLCAVFARRNDAPKRYPFQAHEQGFHCFSHEVERKAK